MTRDTFSAKGGISQDVAQELLEALEWAVQFTPKNAANDRALRIITKARGQA